LEEWFSGFVIITVVSWEGGGGRREGKKRF